MKLPLLGQKGLSIERLRAFCAVVETGSVIGAADGDPIRQSQISRQIKELEDALDVKLFERVNRRLIPTNLGRELAVMTVSYFSGIAELTRLERQHGELIRIAAAESVLSAFIVPRFDRIREALPEFRFALRQCSTDEATQMLRTGRADVAIVRDTAHIEGLDAVSLGLARYRLAIPRGMLPGGQKEGLQRLNGLSMGALSGTGEFNRMLSGILATAGVNVRIIAESETFATLRELVLTGALAAVLPEWSARSLPTESVAIIALPEFDELNRKLVVVTDQRLAQLRPTIGAAIAVLADIWRP